MHNATMNVTIFKRLRHLNSIAATLLLLFSIAIPGKAVYAAVSNWVKNDQSQVALMAGGYSRTSEGQAKLYLGLYFKLAPGWHIYYKDPGDTGFPPTLRWNGSTNIGESILYWPEPTVLKEEIEGSDQALTSNVYTHEVLLPIIAVVDDPTLPAELDLHVDYAACASICIPLSAFISVTVPPDHLDFKAMRLIHDYQAKVPQLHASKTLEMEQVASQLPKPSQSLSIVIFMSVIGLAIIGGLVLNVMPCVLPVLSIKLMHVIKQGGRDKKRIALNFMVTAIGIITTFVLLGLIVVAMQYAGRTVGWGFYFQEPVFLITMIVILVLAALNIWGVFQIVLPSSFQNLIYKSIFASLPNTRLGRKEAVHYFFEGVLATILATPCTAPFLGTAVGFALSQGPTQIIILFFAIGFGMAIPCIVLSVFPALVSFLPKPGSWMKRVKFILGLLLVATAIWLGWVLAQQDPKPVYVTPEVEVDMVWEPFVPEVIQQIVSEERKIVFVDVTASWCLTCKVNKVLVLNSPAITNLLARDDVVAMRADWTKRSDKIARYLKSHNRLGIPFNVVYGPNAPEGIILPELLTEGVVFDAFLKAGEISRSEE